MPMTEEIEVAALRERGWRDVVDAPDDAYRVLAASVRTRGILDPLVVRALPGGAYQLVSGARRLQAARESGRTTVPAVVRDLGDAEALVAGAWPALTRTGVSDDEARRVRGLLVAAGLTEEDADLLVGSLPRAGESVELTGQAAAVEKRAPAWAWGRRGARRR
jgi:ParB family chromosome partitioning protein